MSPPVNPKRKARLLVVDDDPGLLRLLTIRLRAENYEVEAAENGVAALAALARVRPDLVLTDLRMDQLDGIGLLKEIQNRAPGLRVIILTAHGTIPDAVQATQSGAFAFLTKPVDKQELLDKVQKALKVSGFADTTEDWRSEIITRSAAMEERLAQAHMVAGTDARVMITGESGTGKEFAAPSTKPVGRNRPFAAIIAARLSATFGSERWSRARRLFVCRRSKSFSKLLRRPFYWMSGDTPMGLQVKLLRVLQENQVRPVGSTEAVPVNVRIVSSTHRDLKQLIMGGQFREDLFYRLNVVNIDMPQLTKRREDIPLLVSHFLERIAKETGGHRHIYAPEAVECSSSPTYPARPPTRNVVANVGCVPAHSRRHCAGRLGMDLNACHRSTRLAMNSRELPLADSANTGGM